MTSLVYGEIPLHRIAASLLFCIAKQIPYLPLAARFSEKVNAISLKCNKQQRAQCCNVVHVRAQISLVHSGSYAQSHGVILTICEIKYVHTFGK